MSYEYLARPDTLSGPSSRLTDVPMTVGFSGHLYLSGTRGAGGGAPGPCGFCALATSHPLRLHRGLEDPDERPAPADVAVQPLLRLLNRRVRVLFEQRHRGHDEARRAEPAHQPVGVAEGLLHRVQRAAIGEPVDGADLLPLDFDRERRTGIDRSPVHDHGARAARAAIAHALVARHVG